MKYHFISRFFYDFERELIIVLQDIEIIQDSAFALGRYLVTKELRVPDYVDVIATLEQHIHDAHELSENNLYNAASILFKTYRNTLPLISGQQGQQKHKKHKKIMD